MSHKRDETDQMKKGQYSGTVKKTTNPMADQNIFSNFLERGKYERCDFQ
jgi:hypothetical protein